MTDYPELILQSLSIARVEFPSLDIQAELAEFEELVSLANTELAEVGTDQQRLQAFNRLFFDNLGFIGDHEDYYNPRNSCVNAVMETRCGIPITLSVLYFTLAQTVGLEAYGICFPGHFLVGCQLDKGIIYLDPYDDGKELSTTDLDKMLEQVFDKSSVDETERNKWLVPASQTDILTRMLRNLKDIYFREGDQYKALDAVNRILELDPESAGDIRDRGLLYYHMERLEPAILDLTSYLKLMPEAEDTETVRKILLDMHEDEPSVH